VRAWTPGRARLEQISSAGAGRAATWKTCGRHRGRSVDRRLGATYNVGALRCGGDGCAHRARCGMRARRRKKREDLSGCRARVDGRDFAQTCLDTSRIRDSWVAASVPLDEALAATVAWSRTDGLLRNEPAARPRRPSSRQDATPGATSATRRQWPRIPAIRDFARSSPLKRGRPCEGRQLTRGST